MSDARSDLRSTRALGALLAPTEIRDGFQVSVHECPKLLLRELQHVFPGRRFGKDARALALLTCQHALLDLSQFGAEADHEKDRLLEAFVAFAQHVSARLLELGFWADFIDPCSGLPMLTLQANKVYSEVDGVEVLLRYRCLSAGMCKILLHPAWGAAVYPASLFTDAPFDAVQEAILSSPFSENPKAAAPVVAAADVAAVVGAAS
ncbi:hypothetical protein PybrP1_005474 [[Pythium] brassicae (nom. inval.)]|nr:hypothetical protein PybrP1_005474 [[Pythium] brassicae (nom. inval.)]